MFTCYVSESHRSAGLLRLIADGYNDLRCRAPIGPVWCLYGCVDDDDVGDLDSRISNSLGHLGYGLAGLGSNTFRAKQGFDHYRY